MAFSLKSVLVLLALFILDVVSYSFGQNPQSTPVPTPQRGAIAAGNQQPSASAALGSINGTVLDQSGAMVVGARVKLTGATQNLNQELQSDAEGQFSFPNVIPGNFQLTITSPGFATQTVSGVLQPGQIDTLPEIVLAVATNVTEVQVGLPQVEVAEQQIKVEEHQRVIGAIPNFYVSYIPNAAPLTPRQKFQLAWKTVLDPVTFLETGGLAGVQQAQNHFIGYGQGVQGYGKRFGADYADAVSSTFVGSAILAILLKQDPRYFYKGHGSTGSRFLYAIANAVICKGDNRRWQPNYSNILGNVASGGISNIYYPSQNRNGAELTFANAAIGLGSGAFTNVLQEFVLKKLTPLAPKSNPVKPKL
jgi:Carboxypeptidase regulatory-like domain